MFADFFPDDLIPEIIDLVLRSWRSFQRPRPDEEEVPITRRFREVLVREKNRADLPFTVWRESSEPADPVIGRETGRIDIVFLHGYREGVYFAFECKRLNVRFPSGFSSQAAEYVGIDGMMCFITEKYARGLRHAGMIGYVMDGDVAAALRALTKAIVKKARDLCMSARSCLEPCAIRGDDRVKETTHSLPGRKLTLYHILLSV
ncbi:MAG: hypothetical protein NTW86_02485 [Candidatus Sumerlaeota bacterium]|nr:hypothetical protein [Candidatus Sumerlaeota bacterium]